MSDAPPPVTVVNPDGASDVVLLCEHASNYIPAGYGNLGLPLEALQRHIAWDIGAAALARRLSARLDASLFLAGYSRLLIDLNRPLWAPTSIPELSEDTSIPGNRDLTAEERQQRAVAWFHPFHDAVSRSLDRRAAAGRRTLVIGVHSFTPTFLGVARPWHAGVLYGQADRLGRAIAKSLETEGDLLVGDNEPYRIETEHDYTVPVHGDARGNEAVLLEVRQDLLGGDEEADAWAARLARAISDAAV
jgi:predicted N-formylglutamate amidohydrolase